MKLLNHLRVVGYRNVNFDHDLGDVNLFVGPNNCGKSNLFRGMTFIRDIVRSGSTKPLGDAVSAHGGRDLIDWKQPRPIQLGWHADQRSYELDLGLSSKVLPVVIAGERIVTAEGSLISDGQNATLTRGSRRDGVRFLDEYLPALADEASFPEATGGWRLTTLRLLREIGAGLHSFSSFKLDHDAVRRPVTMGGFDGSLGDDGSELVNAIRHLEQNGDDHLEAFTAELRQLMPELNATRTTDDSGKYRWLQLKFGGHWRTFSDVSDGTVQAVALAFLLRTPAIQGLVAIDEPELGLHPAWQQVVARWAQTSQAQVLISTHSADILDHFTDGYRAGVVKVFVAGPEGFSAADPEVLRTRFDEGWQLGDLYRVGEPALGGWPS